MKARTIFVEGAITPSVYADPSRVVTQPDYPLLVPLLEAWLFDWALPPHGPVDDRLAGVPAVLFFAALLALFYGRARHAGVASIAAFAGVAYLASIGYLSGLAAAAFADVPLAVYGLVAAAFCYRWIETRQPGDLLVAAVAGGLMPWTKREGLMLLCALCASLLFLPADRGRKSMAVAAMSLAALVLVGGWWLTIARSGLPGVAFRHVSMATIRAGLPRLPRIGWWEATNLLTMPWSFFGPVLLLTTIAAIKEARRRPDALLLATAFAYLLAMSGSYVFSDYVPYGQHVISSFFRVAVHVTPIAALWLVLRVASAYGLSTR